MLKTQLICTHQMSPCRLSPWPCLTHTSERTAFHCSTIRVTETCQRTLVMQCTEMPHRPQHHNAKTTASPKPTSVDVWLC